MKRSALLYTMLAVVAPAMAQDQDLQQPNQQTSAIPSARFEVLQSSLLARFTFRLDRKTGRVWQLVSTKGGDDTWDEMAVIDLPKLHSDGRPRFQLFASGLLARHTFLLDTETGKTWMVVKAIRKRRDGSEYEDNLWQPVD